MQAGYKNGAMTSQTNDKLSLNQNAALTSRSAPRTTLSPARSPIRLALGLNGSLIAQIGNNNTAMVGQQNDTGLQPMIGANLQATVQVGTGNYALTSQIASAAVSNTR